jgi:hypothetical protein
MDFAALCLTDFIDWRNLLVYCLYCCPSNFSLTYPSPLPLPKLNVQYIQTVCGGVGGVELCFRPYSAGVLHSVFDQI